MWAETIHLAIGHWHLGVRVDSEATAARVRSFVAAHVATTDVAPRSNFSLRAPTGRLRRRPGALYRGGRVLAEARSFDRLLGVLGIELSQLQRVDRPRIRVDLRGFVHDDRIVLTDVRESLPDDAAWLLEAGVRELDAFELIVDLESLTVEELPLLDGLDWRRAGVDLPEFRPRRWDLEAVVVGGFERGDLATVWARATSDRDGWLDALRQLRDAGNIVSVADPAWFAPTIAARLGIGPSTAQG